MSYNVVLPRLTRDFVLSYVTQEEIMEAYLNTKVQTSELFCSPLRTDSNPTCGFRYNTYGRLRMRDFSGDFHGDCFDAVARVIHRDATRSIDFNLILEDIAKRFKIHKYAHNPSEYHVNFDKKDIKKTPKQSDFTIIDVVKRDWDKKDAKFWTSFGISKYTLQYFNVLPCQEVYVNGKPRYTYNRADPCYVYYLGKDKHGRNLLKIYFPFRKKRRFITNANILQGYRKLPPIGRTLVITKSYKDIMAISRFSMFGDKLYAVAPSSESSIITLEQFNDLNQRFEYMVSLYDFDKLASIKTAYKMKEKYRIEPMFFTDGRFGTRDYGAKDFAAYIKVFGVEMMNNLLESIEYEHEDLVKEQDLQQYEQIAWINR